MRMNAASIFMGSCFIAGRGGLLKCCRLYYWSGKQIRIVSCFQTHKLFLKFLKSVHQSVSVGHYLLHPNNRVQPGDTAGSGQSLAQSTSLDPRPFDMHNVKSIHQCSDLHELFLPGLVLLKGVNGNKNGVRCESDPRLYLKSFLDTTLQLIICHVSIDGIYLR